MDFTALDQSIADLQARLQFCDDEIARFRIASSITDEYKRAIDIERVDLAEAIVALQETRALLVQIQAKVNETLAYLRVVDIPAPPASPGDL